MRFARMSALVSVNQMHMKTRIGEVTFVCSKAGSMICFQIALRAVWSSFESRDAGCILSLLNTLSPRSRGRGVTGTTSEAGLEPASSTGKGAESEVGENR